jgi:sugar lactone lactonase YvrE
MSIRTAAYLLFAVLQTAGAGPALADSPSGAPRVCEIRQAPEERGTVSADGLFNEVCSLPAGFARGLVLLDEGYAVADRHEDLIVFCDRQGQRLRTLEYPAYEPTALSWDGEHLVAADRENGRIYFLDPQSGEAVRTIESPLTPVVGVACNEEGQLWVAAVGSEELQLVDPYDGTTLASLKAPASRLTALAFDPNGYLWAADAHSDLIYLVDIRTGYTIFQIPSPGPVPEGLWLDGNDLHVSDYQTDTVSRTDVYALHGLCLRSDERRGHVTLFSELENLGPGTVTGGTMVVAIPTNGPNQELETLAVTEGGRLEKDQWDQEVSVFELGELVPGRKLSVRLDASGTFYRISYKIFPHLVGGAKDIPGDICECYLTDADKYRAQGEYIQGKVAEIIGEETNFYFRARKLYDFLIGRINYQMVGGWDIAPTVIERGTGSCSEYTFSYVALCRAAGIPARYVGAMVLRGEDSSVDTAYHRWAEIYLPQIGWIPVDVNAGDREWQGERCFSFGGIANRFLITTRGGGDSDWLKWNYNVDTEYRTLGKANVRVEGFAEWDVPAPETTE